MFLHAIMAVMALSTTQADLESETIPFFAYSSMIDKDSGAAKAISPAAVATQRPAIGFGYQRTFNRMMPAETVEKGWGPLQSPNDLGILNIFPKEGALLNGVVYDLPCEDLLILTKREVGYDLIPIMVKDANEPFLAYTFQAPDNTGYTSAHINPIPGYFNYLQKGVNAFGDDFKAMWWQTTYLADKTTLVQP